MKVKTGLILISITLFLILSNLGKEKVSVKEKDLVYQVMLFVEDNFVIVWFDKS